MSDEPRKPPIAIVTITVVVVAAAAFLAYLALDTDNESDSPTSTSNPSATTEPQSVPGSESLRVPPGIAAPRVWIVTEENHKPRTYAASFTINSDGGLLGHDGCNAYSTTATFEGDKRVAVEGTEIAIDGNASCPPPEASGWRAPFGSFLVAGDSLTIENDSGSLFAAVDLQALEVVSAAEQIVGSWVTSEGLRVTFDANGSIAVSCATIGTWSFDGQLRTSIDTSFKAPCLGLVQLSEGETLIDGILLSTTLPYTYDELLAGAPTVRVLPDGSLLFGASKMGRLLPT